MIVTHRFQARGTCPVNSAADEYEIAVQYELRRTDSVPMVEKILLETEMLLAEPILQEQFTVRLARALRARRVTTTCRHGEVLTECVCEPPGGGWPGKVRGEAARENARKGMINYMDMMATMTPEQRDAYRLARKKKFPPHEAKAIALGARAS